MALNYLSLPSDEQILTISYSGSDIDCQLYRAYHRQQERGQVHFRHDRLGGRRLRISGYLAR